MESVLDKCLTPTTEMIANLIEIENAHINTNHPDFVGSADSLLNLFAGGDEGEESKNDNHSLLKKTPGDGKTKGGKDKMDGIDDAQIIGDDGKSEETKEEEKSSKGYLDNYMPSFMGGK